MTTGPFSPKMQKAPWTVGLAIFFSLASLLTLFVWIPLDIETGVIETFRRRVTIGDAMAPTIMAVAILVVSVVMGILTVFEPAENSSDVKEDLDKQSFVFLARLVIVVSIGLVLMVYLGPMVVDLINTLGGEIGSYRNLRATYPYKLIGYVFGGFVLIFGIISVVENRFSMNGALVSIIAVVVITMLYELPFDNLLLPPNGAN
nr:hypothetical protein [Rhodospirillales bacterium]